MGTTVSIEVDGLDHDRLADAAASAFTEMARIEELMSPGRPDSEVARLSTAKQEMTVTPETAAVISRGLEVASRSGGAFDLTLGRLKLLWGIEEESPHVPATEEITAALKGIGPSGLRVVGNVVYKSNPELTVDLGGIAKGYAVDRAISVLREHGVTSAAVNAGGDIALLGHKQGRPWRIGVQHPRRPGQVVATIEASDRAVVTSGDYERFFEQNGHRYHHIFDPYSGYPAENCQSVTILAPEAILADALSTAVFVLGPQKGLKLLEDYPDVDALIIDSAGQIQTTPSLHVFASSTQ